MDKEHINRTVDPPLILSKKDEIELEREQERAMRALKDGTPYIPGEYPSIDFKSH